MRGIRKLRLRFLSLFDRFRVENDLEDELRDYLERETEREIAAGSSARRGKKARDIEPARHRTPERGMPRCARDSMVRRHS